MKKLTANDEKTYWPLYYLLDDVASQCDTYADFLQKKDSTSLIQEFQKDLGEHYKDNVGTNLREDIGGIISQLRDIAYKLNDMIFDIEKITETNE